ncbi:heavy-metal-associated domain-containing protein [Pseudomonas sp. NPDC089530]|uniref:heavy-metal-associated domain-containing protein n=1 Tax=Pseudomonas sp. NPDC089530 TaxID=3390651 RepID=UPI003CFEDD57
MLRFHIPNMTCGGCAKSVTRALLSVDPQARIETDPPTREVRVESTLDANALRSVLSEAGYPDQQ